MTVFKVKLKSVDFAGSSNYTLKKQGTDDYSNDNFADDGNITINYPEWQDTDLDGTADKNDPACYKINATPSMTVVLNVEPSVSGVPAKLRVKSGNSIFAQKDISLSGNDFTISGVQWSSSHFTSVSNSSYELNWELSFDEGETYTSYGTTETQIFVVYDEPINYSATARRVDWAITQADGITGKTQAAEAFKNNLGIITTEKDFYPQSQTWNILDDNRENNVDCISIACLACAGLNMIGIAADYCWSYPTADGTIVNGHTFPAVSSSSCRSQTILSFDYQGENFEARLGYPGNRFEGFFTIDDFQIKAYTVYPPAGPFTNQNYYYLEVLRSVTNDQLWVWNGTQTVNNITVSDWAEVPNQPHITVPDIP